MRNTNQTVAEALSRAHAALLEDLRRLEEAASAASEESLAWLRGRLDATRMHIGEHFRFEEQNGYLDVVSKREPRLDRAIQQLVEEHRQLAQALDFVVAEVKAATGLDDKLREEVRGWVKRVRQHEAREDRLIQDAFNLDIGAED